MRDKSKFIAFLLSVIPGLSHLYIGLKERGFIFFILLVVGVTGGLGLTILSGDSVFIILTMIGYLILWLIALLDMYSAWRSIEMRQLYNNDAGIHDIPNQKLNKKSFALALSVVPGAGHMYLGYQKKGVMIMGAFFFSIFFMGWLGISMLLFILPLIWFYSFFDAMHIADGPTNEINEQAINFPGIKPEFAGIALIGIGAVIIIERVLYPLIDYHIRSYIQTSVVSLIFIAAGIYMLVKNKKNIVISDDTDETDEMDKTDEEDIDND